MATKLQQEQGERLLLLVRKSGKDRSEVAQMLHVHPNHLSKLYRQEELSPKVISRACAVFDVPESYFTHSGETLSPEVVRELEDRIRKAEEESEMLRRLYKMALERIEKLEGEVGKEPKQD